MTILAKGISLAEAAPVLAWLPAADSSLQDFSAVAEKTGTYTAFDYADIVEYLNRRWRIAERRNLTGEVSNTVSDSMLQSVQNGYTMC
jgi:hypothetical protein